ncbi:AI-2E family transporter [bacterium]|nr:AI-2E family transporter [bacterium]
MIKTNLISAKNVLAFCLFLVVIYLAITSMDIILMLFASFVVVCAIRPLIDKLALKLPRQISATIVVLGVIIVVALIFIPLLGVCINEAVGLGASFVHSFERIDDFSSIKILGRSLSDFVTFDSIQEPLTNTVQAVVQNAIVAGKSVATFFTTVLGIFIIVFYYVSDEQRIKDKFIEFFPKKHKDHALRILENIETKLGNYVVAQGLAMVFVGFITTLGLLLLGNEHAFLLGFIACVFDIIPVIGPVLAAVVGCLSVLDANISTIILTLAVYLIAQWTENQFIRPILFGKFLNMHPLMIIISLLLCARFFGFWGLILAPVIASVICILVDELYLNKINK